MISVEEALARVLAKIHPLPTMHIPLSKALGLILAEDIIAQEDMPPFANSAMDGFALRSDDSVSQNGQPPRLKVIGGIAAGYVSHSTLVPGTAMRIMTGAPIPPGADTVIQIELTRYDGPNSTWVDILQELVPGNNIRHAGEDIQKNQTVLKQGAEITAWDIGLLASLGWAKVPVVRQARVAIMATGDEIIDVDQPLQPGKIRNSNSHLLEAAAKKAGAKAYRLGVARDTVESLREKFAEASTYDLILTSGGVSVGDFDLVKNIMAEQGQIDFWRVNMKPGKPIAFGYINGVPLLGLPGNPVSTAVTFELFGRPIIRKLQGNTRLMKPQIPVVVADDIQDRSTRRHYVRAHVEWQKDHFIAHITGKQDSHILSSLSNANAFIIVPEGGMQIQAGETAQALMLNWPEI